MTNQNKQELIDKQILCIANVFKKLSSDNAILPEGIDKDEIEKCNQWLEKNKGIKSAFTGRELNYKQGEKNKLNSEVKQLEAKKEELEEEIGDDKTEDTLEYEKSALEQKMVQLKGREDKLNGEVERLETKKEELEEEIGDDETEDTLEYRKTKLEKKIEDLDTQLKTETDELNKNLENHEEEINTKKEELDKDLENHEGRINTEKGKLDEDLENHEEEINTKKEELNKNLENHKNAINTDKKDLDRDLAFHKENINIQKYGLDKYLQDHKEKTEKEVKIIDSFKDFLQETNRNMILYSFVIILLVIILGILVFFGLRFLSDANEIYKIPFNSKDGTTTIYSTGINMLINSCSILILKAPFAFGLCAFIAGCYKLIKSVLSTYEKINKQKRDASVIHAIMNTLNDNSTLIVSEGEVSFNFKGEEDVSEEKIKQIRDRIKWNEVLKYFSSLPLDSEKSSNVDKLPNRAWKRHGRF